VNCASFVVESARTLVGRPFGWDRPPPSGRWSAVRAAV